jgi:phytoene dehydrogenase-like protein
MYPVLGWQYMYDCLLEAIGKKGQVRPNATVKRVIIEQGRAVGVELASGETITAPRVVVNLPVQELHQVVDEKLLPADFAALCKNLRPTAGVVLDYGLSRPISEDSGLWYLWEPMSFGIFTSNLCSAVAPPGKQLLTWFAPANVEDMADPQKAKALEQKLEAAIFKVFPALQDAQQWRRAMHLKVVDGVEVNVDQRRGKRPGYRVPGVEALFLVGDSLKGPGAGGDVGHESVLQCYREITGREL